MKTFTVAVEHGPKHLREVTTRLVAASNFDAAVKTASDGLQNPKAMSVSIERDSECETGSLFGAGK